MADLRNLIPDIPVFLTLPAEERARVVLSAIASHGQQGRFAHRQKTVNVYSLREWAGSHVEPLQVAVTEAWMWLERELLIAPAPDQDRDWVYITKRGTGFLEHGSPIEWAAAERLQREQFDPKLAADVGASFRRGDFTLAVGQAFLTVELRVRALGGIGNERVQPADLAWRSFKAGGPLHHPGQEEAEAKATCELFAGAMGRFRNPHLHGRLVVATAEEAIRRIQFADLLLYMAEAHRKAAGDSPAEQV